MESKTTASERLKSLIKELEETQLSFSKKLEISQSSIASAIMRDSKLSSKLIGKIIKAYPNVNIDWLLTGDGAPLKNETVSEPQAIYEANNAKAIDIQSYEMIPLIPIRARAGYLAGYGDQEYIDDLPTVPVIIDRTFHGKYRCFEVEGDSMDDGTRDSLCDKDIIMGREVRRDLWRDKLHFNKWKAFVIVHKSGILIKQIVDHNTETGIITCHSLNPVYNEDFELNLNDVFELYNVIKLVDRGMN